MMIVSMMIPTEKMSREQLLTAIDDAFSTWQKIYQNGCSDPSWEDGVNLNLVRNHIIAYYRVLDERAGEPVQLSLLSAEQDYDVRRLLPPKVDSKYMARPNELLSGAQTTLTAIRNDENYQWIVSLRGQLSKNVEKNSCFTAVANYVDALEHAIMEKRFPRLRNYQNLEYWRKAYVEMRMRIEAAIEAEQKGELTVCEDE